MVYVQQQGFNHELCGEAHLFKVLDSPLEVMHLLIRHATLCMALRFGINVG